jgi:hypothetical protein
MKKESINDELDKLSPWLRDMKRQDDGFRLPEGYFDAMEQSVFGRLESSGGLRKSVNPPPGNGLTARIGRKQWMWAAAAVFATVLAAAWFFGQPGDASAPVVSVELTEEEIESYVLDNIRDFDAELLADVPVQAAPVPDYKPAPAAQPKQPTDPIDDLSDEEIELLLKDMSDEELENLLKT